MRCPVGRGPALPSQRDPAEGVIHLLQLADHLCQAGALVGTVLVLHQLKHGALPVQCARQRLLHVLNQLVAYLRRGGNAPCSASYLPFTKLPVLQLLSLTA